jgi:hypothetical protein
MKYYEITIRGYGLCPDCNDVHDFFSLRKRHLKITTVMWIPVGVEVDPMFIGCVQTLHIPVLLFLN